LSDSYKFGQLADFDQRTDLCRAAKDAEWRGAKGPYEGVIRQLRFRGYQFTQRATWIYRGLLLVIFLGLLFYLGLPYWEKYVDGTRETLKNQQAAHLAEHKKLDQQRDAIIHGSEASEGLVQMLALSTELVSSDVSETLNNAIIDGENVLLFGDGGSITRSTDGGRTFELVSSEVQSDLKYSIVNSESIILFGSGEEITRSTDGGKTFSSVSSDLQNNHFSITVQIPASESTDFDLYVTGVSRAPRGFNGSVESGKNILLFGDKGTILRSTDQGRSFSQIPFSSEVDFTDAFTNGEKILLTGRSAQIALSKDGGATFHTASNGFRENELIDTIIRQGDGLFFANLRFNDAVWDNNTVLLFGDSGTIFRSIDGGQTFEYVSAEIGDSLLGSVAQENSIILFGAGGTITRSTDGGELFFRYNPV